MREYTKKTESQSHILDSNPKASRQAPIDVILQRYKGRNIQRFDTAQREEIDKNRGLLGKFKYNPITEHKTIQREERPNDTGLPDNRKAGIKNLSGYTVCQFVSRNVWSQQDGQDMFNEYTAILRANGGVLTPQQFADGLLASINPIFWYGRTPETDEQVEIMASANYLHEHKQNWQNELQQRQNNRFHAQRRPSWEKYQRAVADQTKGEQIQPPWFLNSTYGYKIRNPENIVFRDAANHELNNPLQNDPQQILGSTYDRDTNFSIGSSFARRQTKMLNNASNYADCANYVGFVLRLFDGVNMNAPHEMRLIMNNVRRQHGGFDIEGTVIETPNFGNGGFHVGAPLIIKKNVFGITIDGVVANYNPWCAQLVSRGYYNAVILAEDGLGIRYQIDPALGRNRGAAVGLDDATMATIRARYNQNDNLSYRNSLGPERNKINIEELGWKISVAQYRRLGGDAIFTEAYHLNRNPAQYSNLIQPSAFVNVTNPNWYYDSQQHNPNRFVGGRSNSTLLYLKTASILFQQNQLNLDECLDVMAFVIADMVVSGEHSMPECMTSVVMAARYSPPWNRTALNLAAAQQTLHVWLHLINSGVKQNMYNKTKQSLINLVAPMNQLDAKLIKVLTVLGKQLYNHV